MLTEFSVFQYDSKKLCRSRSSHSLGLVNLDLLVEMYVAQSWYSSARVLGHLHDPQATDGDGILFIWFCTGHAFGFFGLLS